MRRQLSALLCILGVHAAIDMESSQVVALSAKECKDTKPESECKSADDSWKMCSGGGWYADQCKKTCKLCTPSGGGGPAPTPAPARRRRSGGGGGGTCSCKKSTSWDGSFGQYADGSKDFCDQGWGSSTPYVCAGGGSAGAAIPCTSDICTSGQYTFSEEEGWKILAKGGMPYRAFAFVKFCNGKQISECWKTEPVKFSFSFKTEDMASMKTFVKLFFWTDNGNMLGLIPPKHSKSGGKYLLATFMKDDYPNKWQDQTEIEDGKWYHVQVTFTPSSKGISMELDGKVFSEGTIPVNMLGDQNGPQLGAYVFGPGEMKMWINDICVGTYSGTCPSGTAPAPPPTDSPSTRRRTAPTPAPSTRRRSPRRRSPNPAPSTRRRSPRRRTPEARRRTPEARRRTPEARRRSPRRRATARRRSPRRRAKTSRRRSSRRRR